MIEVITTEQKPIKIWATNVEQGALGQAKNLANLPFICSHVALMSDTHQGYGMPIGGVIALRDAVIPNAVGVDIACGMLAVRTSLTACHMNIRKAIMGEIRKVVPVGFAHQSSMQPIELMPDADPYYAKFKNLVIGAEFNSARKQLGTLGGGNHFIEIQKGDDGYIWFMIHSGSRNLGKKVADHYNAIAKDLNETWRSSVPRSWDLAFLPLETFQAQQYLAEMSYCLEFAHANRSLMATRIKESFQAIVKDVTFDTEINIHHNYAVMEHHFGENVLVHRKGATLAREGTIGLIPGSQGTCSYVVAGLGNKDSFESCSHGAGRVMGRKRAEETLSLADEIKRLDDKGIVHSIRSAKDLDEAAGAYKDIDVVMQNQSDLVKIVTKLEPLGVIKG